MPRLSSPAPTQAPSAPSRFVTRALLGILVLALVVRVWGISFGLPYDFTADEIHEIVRALKLGAGEYSWTAGKGGLYYFLFVEYGFLFVAWWLMGRVEGPTEFALLYIQDPTAFYLAGRLTVALMGVLTCLVVYSIGRRIYDWRVGLGAAFIGATAYYHAMWSHYINVDTGMTLAMWASILAYIIYENDGRLRWLIAAGILAGGAVAFKLPGLVTLPVLLLAIAFPWRGKGSRAVFREAVTVTFSMFLTITVISPENIKAMGSLAYHFSNLFMNAAWAEASTVSIREDIYAVTILREGSYFRILSQPYNIALSLAVLVGAAIGCWRRNRWDIIWTVFIGLFFGVMVLADRPGIERYLFPILPAFWLLGARAVFMLAGERASLLVAGFALIVAWPLFALVKQNHTWTRPDTRVMAKEWIEANIPSGSKILMDGMRYRFIFSPPLNPDEATVARRLNHAEDEDGQISRGISGRTMELYANAMSSVSGPRYELHSTVWGLEVRDLSYYPEACFDYVVTSSGIANRFSAPSVAERYPESAAFYNQLPQDSRYRLIYAVEPIPWKVQGPGIAVYEVLLACR
jgi:4-amino-4-deoxy-L-arabinose transferase-like glycosyltransferase